MSVDAQAAAGAIELGMTEVAIAASLVLIAGVISLLLRLGLERRLALASVRTVVQLLILGFILKWIFGLNNPVLVLLITLLMVIAASVAAVQRISVTFAGVTLHAFLSLIASSLVTTTIVTAVIIQVRPWYNPQYIIPLLGMILGNGLTGLSLCLDTLLESLRERRDEVEMELAHGATRWEAARRPMAAAVKRGMIPIINSMMVVGIVSLPGMMTGQILQGADPVHAVKYQIMVMFMLAAATSMSSIIIVLLTFRRLFNAKHQLQAHLLIRKKR